MNILVIGSGSREHALAWKLKQSPKVSKVYCAPGNAGMAEVGENIAAKSVAEITDWLTAHPVDLVVVGSDQYLADGVTDEVLKLGIPVFGPTRAAAEVEWSKAYAKQLMHEEGIPTAAYETFTDVDAARAYIATHAYPLVVKADGLAAGKGVVIAATRAEADAALVSIMSDKVYGAAGAEVVIEEYLEGLEISTHAFVDGTHAVMFPPSKDHKRIGEGDTGPNTGGMGVIAPVPQVSDADMQAIHSRIVAPLVTALAKRGRPFRGALYPGIMLTKDGPKVIEFNARFGQPEAEAYVRLLDTDLFDICYACATGSVAEMSIAWSSESVATVMIATKGYPDVTPSGMPITGAAEASAVPGVVVFHVRTSRDEDGTLRSGGARTLEVTATAPTLKEAITRAYEAAGKIHFDGIYYRRDIGAKTLARGV